ncbi:MAG: hypothetical protein WC752_03495 [Patescibacteria group bacterium]
MTKIDKILLKLDEHDKKFDLINSKLEEHDKKFDQINIKLGDHDKKFDRLINTVLKNTEEISEIKQNMVYRSEFNDLVSAVDAIAIRVNKIDEDHVFVVDWLQRLDNKVEKLHKFSAVAK